MSEQGDLSSPPLPSFTPGQLWPDTDGVHINAHGGGVLHHDGVYYWYGEHKITGTAGNLAQVGVGVYSSRDLYRWKNEGIALAVADAADSPIVRGCVLERPKVLFNARTNKFVMWFHLEPPGAGYAGAQSGVAVSDRPAGPFTFVRAGRRNAGVWPVNSSPSDQTLLQAAERDVLADMDLPGGPRPYFPRDLIFRRDFEKGQMSRDMTLVCDDDGAAYLIYASEDNGTLHVSQLADDYLADAGRYSRILPGRFHEAPAILKHAGRYFLFTSDCTGWAPNTMRLSVADHPFGPWTELTTPCIGTGAEITTSFESQPTFVLPVVGRLDAYILMSDRWRPDNAIDGRYVWLPIEFQHGVPTIRWHQAWSLERFNRGTTPNGAKARGNFE